MDNFTLSKTRLTKLEADKITELVQLKPISERYAEYIRLMKEHADLVGETSASGGLVNPHPTLPAISLADGAESVPLPSSPTGPSPVSPPMVIDNP
jgi:hypothetical protein